LTIGITKSASEDPKITSDDGDLDHAYNGPQNKIPIFFIKKVE